MSSGTTQPGMIPTRNDPTSNDKLVYFLIFVGKCGVGSLPEKTQKLQNDLPSKVGISFFFQETSPHFVQVSRRPSVPEGKTLPETNDFLAFHKMNDFQDSEAPTGSRGEQIFRGELAVSFRESNPNRWVFP